MSDELHFRTGWLGLSARFCRKQQGRGDAYDESIVIPVLLAVLFLRLAVDDRIPAVVAWGAVFLTGLIVSALLGSRLGTPGVLRIALRGMFTGAIEGALLAVMIPALDHQQATRLAAQLAIINSTCYWCGGLLAASFAELVTVTEEKWQQNAPNRELVASFVCACLLIEKVEDKSRKFAILVRLAQLLVPLLFWMWVAWLFGVGPQDFIRARLSR